MPCVPGVLLWPPTAVPLLTKKVQDVASFFIAEEGLPEDTPALMFEEVKFEPTVMVEPLKPK